MSTNNQYEVKALYRFECTGCRRYHEQLCHPSEFQHHCDSWNYKHSSPICNTKAIKCWHVVPRDFSEDNFVKKIFNKIGQSISEFVLPWYLRTWEFQENNNFQIAFNASSNLTFTSLSGLSSDTGLIAGASSAVVDNGASATLLDLGVTGFIMTGTSPTASNSINLYAWSPIDDSPKYPDGITGSDAKITLASTNVANGMLAFVCSFTNDSTSGRQYYTDPISLETIFGGWVPRKWGLWGVQNTGVALSPSGHQWTAKQAYVAG